MLPRAHPFRSGGASGQKSVRAAGAKGGVEHGVLGGKEFTVRYFESEGEFVSHEF